MREEEPWEKEIRLFMEAEFPNEEWEGEEQYRGFRVCWCLMQEVGGTDRIWAAWVTPPMAKYAIWSAYRDSKEAALQECRNTLDQMAAGGRIGG